MTWRQLRKFHCEIINTTVNSAAGLRFFGLSNLLFNICPYAVHGKGGDGSLIARAQMGLPGKYNTSSQVLRALNYNFYNNNSKSLPPFLFCFLFVFHLAAIRVRYSGICELKFEHSKPEKFEFRKKLMSERIDWNSCSYFQFFSNFVVNTFEIGEWSIRLDWIQEDSNLERNLGCIDGNCCSFFQFFSVADYLIYFVGIDTFETGEWSVEIIRMIEPKMVRIYRLIIGEIYKLK